MKLFIRSTKMHCNKCGGFGFYIVQTVDGKSEGRACDQKSHMALKQDLDGFLSMVRMHDDKSTQN